MFGNSTITLNGFKMLFLFSPGVYRCTGNLFISLYSFWPIASNWLIGKSIARKAWVISYRLTPMNTPIYVFYFILFCFFILIRIYWTGNTKSRDGIYQRNNLIIWLTEYEWIVHVLTKVHWLTLELIYFGKAFPTTWVSIEKWFYIDGQTLTPFQFEYCSPRIDVTKHRHHSHFIDFMVIQTGWRSPWFYHILFG